MTVVTVTHADQSKAGKQRIYVGGKNNWQDAVYVGQRCASVPPVGATIDANMSSKTFPDGRQMWFLNSWQPVNGVAPQQSTGNYPPQLTSAPGLGVPAANPQPAPAKAGWDIPTGDLSRFVSNVVGSAIAANLINTPSEIAQWVGASYRAAESLRSGDVPEFDSDVPRFTEPDPVLYPPDPAAPQGEDEFEGDESIPF
jgi:hypothetical protein